MSGPNQDDFVSKVTDHRLMNSVEFSARVLLFTTTSRLFLGPIHFPVEKFLKSSVCSVKGLNCEADLLSLFTADVKSM